MKTITTTTVVELSKSDFQMRLIYNFAIACGLLLLPVAGNAQQLNESFTSFDIPKNTEQAILVTATSWDATAGKLHRYERNASGWKKVGNEMTVALGKNGLAWGKGLHGNVGSPEKIEGDGRSPAGVFTLGTMFGYHEASPSSGGYHYRQATARDYFIDDVNSKDYNQWVKIPLNEPNTPKAHWGSFERLKRSDHLYEYGIVILHNSYPVEKGKGSAIFFHVWRNPQAPTLGCTSIDKKDLLEVMKWLDGGRNPLLIQVPVSELQEVFNKR